MLLSHFLYVRCLNFLYVRCSEGYSTENEIEVKSVEVQVNGKVGNISWEPRLGVKIFIETPRRAKQINQ